MKINSVVEIRGCAPKTSAKGNAYNVVTIEQGVDTPTLMTTIPLTELIALKGKAVIATLDYDVRFKGLTLVGVECVK